MGQQLPRPATPHCPQTDRAPIDTTGTGETESGVIDTTPTETEEPIDTTVPSQPEPESTVSEHPGIAEAEKLIPTDHMKGTLQGGKTDDQLWFDYANILQEKGIRDPNSVVMSTNPPRVYFDV